MRYERWTGNGRRYGDAECDFVRALTRNQAPRFTLRDARQDVALLEGIHCSRQGCDPGGPGRDDLFPKACPSACDGVHAGGVVCARRGNPRAGASTDVSSPIGGRIDVVDRSSGVLC